MLRVITENFEGWWIVSDGRHLWLPEGKLPQGNAGELGLCGKPARQIGEWQGQVCWLICESFDREMMSVRELLHIDTQLFQLAGRGVQLATFYRSHQWCGYCRAAMVQGNDEFVCLCPNCRERYYPQIAPSMIVAIRRGTDILLAQHVRHRQPLFTVLAGFVESGETLEQCVHREVMEESGITIRNIQYVASQPWPFPHSLMVAFTAEYAEGEINIDNHELKSADWFRYDQLPLIPEPGTIARRLIEDTVILCRDADI